MRVHRKGTARDGGCYREQREIGIGEETGTTDKRLREQGPRWRTRAQGWFTCTDELPAVGHEGFLHLCVVSVQFPPLPSRSVRVEFPDQLPVARPPHDLMNTMELSQKGNGGSVRKCLSSHRDKAGMPRFRSPPGSSTRAGKYLQRQEKKRTAKTQGEAGMREAGGGGRRETRRKEWTASPNAQHLPQQLRPWGSRAGRARPCS